MATALRSYWHLALQAAHCHRILLLPQQRYAATGSSVPQIISSFNHRAIQGRPSKGQFSREGSRRPPSRASSAAKATTLPSPQLNRYPKLSLTYLYHVDTSIEAFFFIDVGLSHHRKISRQFALLRFTFSLCANLGREVS